MPQALRIRLAPVPATQQADLAAPPAPVDGFSPSFHLFGTGPSVVPVGGSLPAQLDFYARWIRSVRGADDVIEEPLATLKGDLLLTPPPTQIRFYCAYESLEQLVQTPELDAPEDRTAAPSTRALEIHLDPTQFPGIESVGAAVPQILLPKERTDEYPYLELLVELTIAGALEAPSSQNDVLDVTLWHESPPRARGYEVQVIDEVGEPLAAVELAFTLGGQEFRRTTDSAGMAKLLSSDTTAAEVVIAAPDALTPELDSRWKQIRNRPVLPLHSELVNRMPSELDMQFGVESRQRRILCIRPPVVMARLKGTYFDTSKCFLLPSAIPSLKKLLRYYEENDVTHDDPAGAGADSSEVLIVGHTDTTGDPSYNFELSAERAESMRAYLRDDHDAWLAWFGSGKPEAKRWGKLEEGLMIQSLVDPAAIAADGETLAYQNWHDALAADQRSDNWEYLEPDGELGSATRKQLVIDYMNRDGTTLGEGVRVVCYGAGEMFPVEASGDLEVGDEDGSDEAEDRRVEVFFFAKPFGIRPPVPSVADGVSPPRAVRGQNGQREYLEWRRRSYKMFECLERVVNLKLFLHDHTHQLMKETEYKLDIDGDLRTGTTNAEGFLLAPGVLADSICKAWWFKQSATTTAPQDFPHNIPEPDFTFYTEIDLSYHEDMHGSLQREHRVRLDNLGYRDELLANAWASFQGDYGPSDDAWFDKQTSDRLREVHHDGIERTSAPIEPSTDGEIDDWEEDLGTEPFGARLRLFDADGNVMNGARFRLTLGGKTTEGTSTDGWVPLDVPEGICVECKIEWGQVAAGGAFPFVRDVMMGCDDPDLNTPSEVLGKLHNLGYPTDLGLEGAVTAFQKREGIVPQGLAADGTVPSPTLDRIRKRYADSVAAP